MTPEEALQKIQSLFEKFGKKEPQINEAKLNDGVSILSWVGEFESSKPEMVTADGKIPCNDGDYELEDGTQFSVQEGKVCNVKKKEAMAAAEDTLESIMKMKEAFASGTPEERVANLEKVCKVLMEYCYGYQMREKAMEAAKEEAVAIVTQFNSQKPAKEEDVATLVQSFQEMKEQFDALKDSFEAAVTERVAQAMQAHTEAFTKLVDVVDTIAKSPAGEPAQTPDKFADVRRNQEDTNERLESIANAIQEFRKSNV